MGKIKKDKISRSSDEKKNKGDVTRKRKNGEKKVLTDDGTRKYGYISTKSIITMAEAAGFSGLQEDVAKNLAEDVTYRLRYIIQQCKKYMIHNRHNRLSCADINEVLKMCDAPKVYGYMVDEPLHNFIYVKEADVFILEDNFVDLPSWALSEIKVQCKSPYNTTGFWIKSDESKQYETKSKTESIKTNSTEGVTHTEHSKHGTNGCTQSDSQKSCNSNCGSETKIPINLIKYYGITCNTILGHSDLKIAFQDLSKSSRILPIVPYFLNFITIALNKLGSERQIRRLLQTVEALVKNTTIDFSPYSATTRVINAMLLIVAMDKKPSKFSFSYNLRSYAARVLAMVLSQWCIRDEQKMSIDKKMRKLLMDINASPKVHYGAIALLSAIGPEALSHNLCKTFKQCMGYLFELKKISDNCEKDVAMLEEAILGAAALVYRHPKSQCKDLLELDLCLYSYFGDAVCNIWTVPFHKENIQSQQDEQSRDYKPSNASSDVKSSKILNYLNSPYKAENKKLRLENVFTLPKTPKKKNTRIIFNFAGAIPVPEVHLKRKRLDNRCSHFIAGKESEGHVVITGKRCHLSVSLTHSKNTLNTLVPVGSLFSIL